MINHVILTSQDFNKIAFTDAVTKGPSNSYGITDQFIEAFTRSN